MVPSKYLFKPYCDAIIPLKYSNFSINILYIYVECLVYVQCVSETFMDDVGVLEKYLDSLRPSIPYNEKFQEG